MQSDYARIAAAIRFLDDTWPALGEVAAHVGLTGYHFQLQVCRALMRIPPGTVTSYGVLAAALDRPGVAQRGIPSPA